MKSMAGTDAVIVFATFQTRDEAEQVGEALVEQRLAACGSVIPTVHSFYHWEGKLRREHEALLLLKTAAEKVPEIEEYIRTEGSHETPEVLAVGVDAGLPAYLEWLLTDVRTAGKRGRTL
jgi:periplasmic divalent cation tolerance protein